MMRYNVRVSPQTLQLDLEGNLDYTDSCDFMRMLHMVKNLNDNNQILCNVSRLEGLDSTGKQLLMRIYDFAKETRRNLTFCDPEGPVLEFLESASEYNQLHYYACVY